MGPTACCLVAGLIEWIAGPRSDQGRPRCPTEAVVVTVRFFLREGVQWGELRATSPLGSNPRPAKVRNRRAPCKGGAFQWVQAPPGDIAPAGSDRSSHG